ncbi:MgsA AAA+ ATPase C terminal family protein [Aspergillus niger]|uniref:MgsA AAA+ ATPase C terminal family protein n=1 Tax=Aspergillus niger TaxID=5061 RepID=A0A505I024_ASPNG|nr:MgsA AAA+ ATPase C terminal family protein [Aspergillus niger]
MRTQVLLRLRALAIILALTWASFVPQIKHVWQTKDSRGISTAYLLFNLLCITEHVFFHSLDIAYLWDVSKFPSAPVSVSPLDWVNLAQVLGDWVLSNVLFALCLSYSPPTRPHRRLRTLLVLALYCFFLLFTLVPLILDLTTDVFCPPNHPHDCLLPERDVVPFLRGIHCYFLLPLTTVILPVLGIFKQAMRIPPSHPPTPTTPTDLNGLLARSRLFQAAIFALSAILWIFRLPPGQQEREDDPPPPDAPLLPRPWLLVFLHWWMFMGYMTVDEAIFAIGQGVLGYLALRKAAEADGRSEGEEAERRPLLVAAEERSTYESAS